MSLFHALRLSAMVSSSLPPLKPLSYVDANCATDTFCSTLMSCFDTFWPLSARSTPSAPWLSVVLLQHRSKLSLSSHPTSLLDPIPSHLLQTISPAVVPAFTHIVNTSLQFLNRLVEPHSYRPVFLLPFIVKTLERVVQPSHCLSHTEQPPGQKPVWLQKWTFLQNCLALSC